MPDVCRGPAVAVAALAYDVNSARTLYAGLDDGTVVAFNTKHRSGDGRVACKMDFKLPGSIHTSPVAVETAKGYVERRCRCCCCCCCCYFYARVLVLLLLPLQLVLLCLIRPHPSLLLLLLLLLPLPLLLEYHYHYYYYYYSN